MQPATRREDTVEDYHGTLVADPYRWLEEVSTQETQAWVQEQHSATRTYLDAIPDRDQIKQRYRELFNYSRYSTPYKKGERYFFSKNTGLQNQNVLYTQSALRADMKAVLDPNALSADGTVALTNQAMSEDGKLLAYGTSKSGSDWQEIRIRRVDDGRDYDEVIRYCKFASIAWRHDSTGFYYNRLPEPGTVPGEDQTNYSKVYWHKVGTQQEEDQLVFERPEAKELSFSPFISNDGAYLLLNVWCGTDPKNRIYYREVTSDEPFIRLLDEADASYTFVGNDGALFYFQTNLDAPRGRIIAIDTTKPERTQWREIVSEQSDVMDFALIVNQQFVLGYMHDAHHQVKLYNKTGTFLREIELPTLGSIMGISGEPDDDELFLSFTSFLYPSTVFRYDFERHELKPLWETPHTFDPSGYETRQVFFTSKDGTRVPMFLTHKKGLVLNNNNPVLIYGYGGFDISLTPNFGITPLLWVERGGIYATVNLRGGNEYGEEWHKAGMLEKKQNVFDDFIAAAEWLIENKYSNSTRIAIEGGSNGGLLVAASMVQRPELYGAVICRVPVIDMLRYHKFTVGRYWISEYGDAEHNAEHFKFMYAYSPLHNVKEGVEYPPTLIMTADTDDRVVPAHAWKFAATLQHAYQGKNPILLRFELKAGHGMGKPTAKIIEEESDILAFLFQTFSMQ
ncbi:prolyl oligopeptidase family serine peptidase [Ktedonobacter racemifer]|uniref:prolyl oligopeptidase n=1 Tax=Ktedonobacter racemifer DSM 44963 TaxID=485913 RepID=D6TBX9_KTERA|nr:prolyl oligopeptidase family serine peptidase [Ktedonobacter racemifer]EFH88015.1 peptidase S9A prolyl oligopeptidase domain protein beta-propeller [Ktedonobacter racemifer DSM 44963]